MKLLPNVASDYNLQLQLTSGPCATAPVPVNAQSLYVRDQYQRCAVQERYLGVPRFQRSRDMLYTAW